MRISEVRRELAPLIGMAADNIRVRTDALYRRPEFRAILPGRRAVGSDREGLAATPAATAAVMLTAMVGKTRQTIGPAVARLWEARCVTPTGNPIEKCQTAGAVLTLLLQRADVRGRLVYFELDHDIPHLAFVFGDPAILTSDRPLSPIEWQQRIDGAVEAGGVARTFYAPYRPADWKHRVDAAFAAGTMAHIARLPASTLDKIAALITAEATGQVGTA